MESEIAQQQSQASFDQHRDSLILSSLPLDEQNQPLKHEEQREERVQKSAPMNIDANLPSVSSRKQSIEAAFEKDAQISTSKPVSIGRVPSVRERKMSFESINQDQVDQPSGNRSVAASPAQQRKQSVNAPGMNPQQFRQRKNSFEMPREEQKEKPVVKPNVPVGTVRSRVNSLSEKDRESVKPALAPVNQLGVQNTIRKLSVGQQQQPAISAANIKDPEEAIKRILDNDPGIQWALFQYANQKIQLQKHGLGGLENLKSFLNDGEVSYGYLRVQFGAEGRTKFVFIKWVGEEARAMLRARAFEDCKRVQEMIKIFHIELPATKKVNLLEQTMIEKLQQAAGANYDKLQNSTTGGGARKLSNASSQQRPVALTNGNHYSSASAQQQQQQQEPKQLTNEFSQYKSSSKAFFQELDRKTQITQITYDNKPLAKQTPVDLSNRPLTIGAAQARAQTVSYKK